MRIRANRHARTGHYFRNKRLKAGLDQEDVARALDYTSTQMVSNWERGLCSPPGKVLRNLMKLYNIKKEELMKFLVEQARIEFDDLLTGPSKSRSKKKKTKRRKKKRS